MIAVFITNSGILAQAIEEEVGFKYVKGNYLFDSGRYDEAIQIYNDIIKSDPSFKDVLIYRANAKYALGAYKGAKKDGMDYVQLNGLNEEVCLILGKAELGLNNPMAAVSYFDFTIMKNKENVDALLYRGNSFFELEDDVKACTDWHKALRLGSDLAKRQANKYCQRVAIPIDEEPKEKIVEVANQGDEMETQNTDNEEVLSVGHQNEDIENSENSTFPTMDDVIMIGQDSVYYGDSNSNTVEEEVIVPVPMDDTVELMEIDEDLDIKIFGGIGSRKVKEIPEILILSDTEGQVVVDICIDKSGNVISASMNRDESTISSAGLISLALRKSRDFRFERSRESEQCGKLAFLIK